MVSVSVPSMSNMTKCMACNLTRKRMEPAGSGAIWTGSPKGVFAGRKHHKPRQGVVASSLKSYRNGAVGFIDWLDAFWRLARRRFVHIEKGLIGIFPSGYWLVAPIRAALQKSKPQW